MALQITAVPAFRDNYIWMIGREGDDRLYIVDPGDAAPVLDYLDRQQARPAAILLTHHHPDHTGGVQTLLGHYDIPVYGPASSAIAGVSHRLREGDSVEVFDTRFDVIAVPGHTLDHIAFHAARDEHDGEPPLLFCGDTLFAGGCGRLFEGDADMMVASLGKLAALPGETLVYCGHEYTVANLAFASAAEPDNEALQQRARQEKEKRDKGEITLPSTLSLELRTNPFLRCHSDSIVRQCSTFSGQTPESETAVFATLRKWKDGF